MIAEAVGLPMMRGDGDDGSNVDPHEHITVSPRAVSYTAEACT